MQLRSTPEIELSFEKISPYLDNPAPIDLSRYCYDDLTDISYHSHSGCFELAVITHGYGYHYLNGGVFEVTKGEAFLLDPDSYHSFYPIDAQNSSRLMVNNCVFRKDAFTALAGTFPQMEEALSFFSGCPPEHPLHMNDHYLGRELSEYCDFTLSHLFKYYEGAHAGEHLVVQLAVAQIMLEAYRIFSASGFLKSGQEMNPLVTEALNYLHQNWNDPNLSMEVLYKHLFVSKSHLCTLFRQALGITPISYLNRLRIKKACEMIRENPDTIEHIYTSVGYTRYSTFYVNFKNYTGFSTRDYCKALKIYDTFNQ